MKRIAACCNHPEHGRPWSNEDGWILAGLVDDSSTWEAWLPEEWKIHCSQAVYYASPSYRGRKAAEKRRNYKRAAA